MCESIADGGRRCAGIQGHWNINKDGHIRFVADPDQEREHFPPTAILSMRADAQRKRRQRRIRRAAEVCAMRTIHGLKPGAPLGPVLRAELWAHRRQGAGLSLLALADRIRHAAEAEGVPVHVMAQRYKDQVTIPHRQSAGERISDLVCERPDWVRPERLVRMLAPAENGDLCEAYVRVVADPDGKEFVLVTSYDGSEPMAWQHSDAGLKAAAAEALTRMQAVRSNPEPYDEWLVRNEGARNDPSVSPWHQHMDNGDFLANSDAMHLV